jgi:EAL domain-containing protein (putative c-di-GMP-specific phosphodiesterase class I)
MPIETSTPDWSALLDDVSSGKRMTSVYQPIVDVARARIAGYEALTRFSAGPRNPSDWFAAALRLGREADLEAAALRSGLRHRDALPRNCFVSINVSPTALLSDEVTEVLGEHRDLRGVVIELTEQAPIESYTTVEAAIDSLRGRGALIAVDDAGAGYAGLRHLLSLRPEIIKLDRALVCDLDIDETKRALVEMLGTFAGRIDAWLLAEGIERPGELRTLADLGVPLAQGYFLGRPAEPWMPLAPEAHELLSTSARPSDRRTVRSLVEPAPVVSSIHQARREFAAPGVEVVVLVDDHTMPLGTITPDTALMGVLASTMRINQDTPIREATLRALTRDRGDRFRPMTCIDGSGRCLGVLHVERLVHALAADAPAAGSTTAA